MALFLTSLGQRAFAGLTHMQRWSRQLQCKAQNKPSCTPLRMELIAISTGKSKPKPKRPNAVRRIMDREQSRERRVRESSVASNTGAAPAVAKSTSRTPCANKACANPRVVDGTCQTCGSVADESNIVSEITFGESSSGAAVVHGTNLAADQAGVRVGGLAFRRVAGGGASEARERSLREAKTLLNQFAQQLRLSQNLADTAHRFYRVASNNNFIQGRRKNNVAAICLYAACRKDNLNKVMLIDLADIIKTDVFLLGRSYKEFLNQFPDMREDARENSIPLEDLIFRFASKLEFYHDTGKVAESAVRIAARMRYDNMTHGRRPAGICGAAIIMAARAHNYRRTVREVVYIAKVTMATLQERMEEFAMVPSAQMTISEFNETPVPNPNRPSGPSFDPPFLYKNSQEWKEKHGRPRKRKAPTTTADDGSQQGNKRPRGDTDQQEPQQPAAVPGPSASTPQPNPPPVVDKDGFVVPPLPQHVIDPALRSDPASASQTESTTDDTVSVLAAAANVENQLEVLASQYGEEEDEDEEDDETGPTSEMAMAVAQGIEVPGFAQAQQKGAKTPVKKKTVALPVNEEWEMDEANLEQEMEGHLNDPALIGATQVETRAIEERRAKETAAVDQTSTSDKTTQDTTAGAAEDNAEANDPEPEPEPEPEPDPSLPQDSRFTPRSKVSDDPIVREDEFKDDPEVQFCMLGEAEIKIKEQIWANHNKDYLRLKQQKQFNAKLAENAPKKRRQRARQPRIGEGQASPAGSAEEAAVNMIRSRGISKKINYSTLGHVFELGNRGPGSTYGGVSSTGTPNTLGSVAGSEMGSDDEDDQEAQATEETTPAPANGHSSSAAASAAAKSTVSAPVQEEEEQGDEDDYNNDTELQDDYDNHNGYEEEETFAEEDYDPFAENDDGNEDGYDDME
ncbi:transcription factor iiib-like protein [Rhypophila decipiens]|uniref:Transcription factor iiib-like protein n=1 Tax=Rhypophila decipiens TaxID=261697 RepID=A0AAN6YBP6_9PEZI|nr:transcription factor iiib-like protein [Rhypophila decipiens]